MQITVATRMTSPERNNARTIARARSAVTLARIMSLQYLSSDNYFEALSEVTMISVSPAQGSAAPHPQLSAVCRLELGRSASLLYLSHGGVSEQLPQAVWLWLPGCGFVECFACELRGVCWRLC